MAQKIDKNTGKGDSRLEGAGTFYALYQTWIVLPGFEKDFWDYGIKRLFKFFPNTFINLKSLPDPKGFTPFVEFPSFKKMTVFEEYQNPILDYEQGDFKEVLNKRHFRSKSNRINRAGQVRFEKVKSKGELISALKDIAVFYDLRQGAAFNKIPFGDDHTPHDLFVSWFDQGILHVSILWFDNELIGAVIIIEDNKTAHLAGLITYSPRHGKFSPGLVHLYYLGQLLYEEGFKNLKLSPGYDSYKERFCNTHEDLYELLISPNLTDVFRRKIRKKIRQNYLRLGVRPMEVGVVLNKKIAKVKNRLNYFFKTLRLNNSSSDNKSLSWARKIVNEKYLPNSEFKKDYLDDLLRVGDFDLNVSRWEFLEDSLKRLEENQKFISLVRDNNLLACIWYNDNSSSNSGENKIDSDFEILKVYVSLSLDLKKD
ncbi:GNAT family N-acetyltransferase [Aquiflexum gelatinilyticum]|uniref:GNAT family N-acetyltransferase n=1 Tax=Aquiflexum gelatinilyticum TaxID=2961943 RepID=UPI00216900C9|nr:GNAT family N-acetyltransferase [Aquiflexum gelatinilyticum]MCS4436620.1 GNAT family N-acetyltransferase [Aquiflexum gelatinilyticum]